MANYQTGYGHGDVVGVPFDFFGGATLVTGSTITMQTGVLVVNPTGTLAALTVNLPLNPVDGAVAEICSTQTLTSLTVAANTGDVLVNGVLGAIASLTLNANAGNIAAPAGLPLVRYKYTLNGFQPASGAAVNPRSWIRIS
jgi:hypothetical protein